MTRRKAKRLYSQALDSYRHGYVKGTNARIQHADRGWPLPKYWDDENMPAYSAGYSAGAKGQSIDDKRLPLLVWVDVLAVGMRP